MEKLIVFAFLNKIIFLAEERSLNKNNEYNNNNNIFFNQKYEQK